MKADACYLAFCVGLCAADFATHHYVWAVIASFAAGTALISLLVRKALA